jgi:hypothetical protein
MRVRHDQRYSRARGEPLERLMRQCRSNRANAQGAITAAKRIWKSFKPRGGALSEKAGRFRLHVHAHAKPRDKFPPSFIDHLVSTQEN